MFGKLVGIAVGAVMIYGGIYELWHWARSRRRLRRVPGMIVGRPNVHDQPGTVKRAAIFRFTTMDGRTVEAESDVRTFPGPKPGKPITVVYDPLDPEEAEIAGWRAAIKPILSPLLIAGGVALLVGALIGLT